MKNKNLMLGILGVICLVLAGAVVYTAFIRQPEAEEADAQPADGEQPAAEPSEAP